MNDISKAAARASRLPSGHPEALLEAIANIYNNFGDTIRNKENNLEIDENLIRDFPNVDDGVRGMKFIDAVIKNSNGNEKWTLI